MTAIQVSSVNMWIRARLTLHASKLDEDLNLLRRISSDSTCDITCVVVGIGRGGFGGLHTRGDVWGAAGVPDRDGSSGRAPGKGFPTGKGPG